MLNECEEEENLQCTIRRGEAERERGRGEKFISVLLFGLVGRVTCYVKIVGGNGGRELEIKNFYFVTIKNGPQ